MTLHFGLDVGSTTVKLVGLNDQYEIEYQVYKRHYSDVKESVRDIIKDAYDVYGDQEITIVVTGSGGLAVEKALSIPFEQEVISGAKSVDTFLPTTDVAIELGGEDSKITYFSGNREQRMNSICAGGTGAFIDQLAALLDTDAQGLNEMAEGHKKIYPIASRCGVFAKTDLQALVNQGATKEDMAVSIFQSVVNQTISNLACGRPIEGNVAFLGGPLYFLPQLRQRFIETLELTDEEILFPESAQLFVAMGAAILGVEKESITFKELNERAQAPWKDELTFSENLRPLFTSKEEYEEFEAEHATKTLKKISLEEAKGPLYLGIDAGSTTTKLVLVDEDINLVYSYYGSNHGKPLELVMDKLTWIYDHLNPEAYIAHSGVTGYGEDFIKAALHLDEGEVETIAHYTAAKYFDPDVDFILDIGGQDMKSMKIKDGVIDSILLNEACSSGCGSFLETFAKSMNMTVEEFSEKALFAENPVDLGSRCTVFMNSKVKQAQKEGATVADIAAGLSYSVIRNALQKVIKVRNPKDLGKNIVVQGGTFYGDAILRAFELISGRKATRPVMAGLMGALGIALIAKERSLGVSTIATAEELQDFNVEVKQAHCRGCTNQCSITVHTFSNGEKFIMGNRCEKGAGMTKSKDELPNLMRYKYSTLFDRESLPADSAPRGKIGVPRVLNMYENYPFWHSFLSALGYRVVLSKDSDRKLYEKGMAHIPSETACYPAKITHGHIVDLLEKGLTKIFYPSIFYEKKEHKRADNTMNCPVVVGYPDLINNNMHELEDIDYIHPMLTFDNEKALIRGLIETFKPYGISKQEIVYAVGEGIASQREYNQKIYLEGQRAMKWIEERDAYGIVLSGRPYHADPEINHGIPDLINSLGLAVLTEDVVGQEEDLQKRIRVLDQWTYHSRLYRAAKYVGTQKNLDMVQLNSFGCGLDAVTTDQVNEILSAHGKIYTVIKIDEISNLGAAKIRLRSLVEAAKKRNIQPHPENVETGYENPLEFTKKEKATHTILAPQMAPIHLAIMEQSFLEAGYKFKFLEQLDDNVIEEGLQYVNNDACYPSLFVVGQMMHAIKSGDVDPDNTTLMMTQTGGACRASNYVGFIRKALKDAGYPNIPVIAVSVQGIENHSGFKLSIPMAKQLILATLYGDLILRLSSRIRPYELNKGDTDAMVDKWIKRCRDIITQTSRREFKEYANQLVADFDTIERSKEEKPKVGIVGEILVKYLPAANNYLQDTLEAEGMEVMVPDLMDFVYYCLQNSTLKNKLFGKSKLVSMGAKAALAYINSYRNIARDALRKFNFSAPPQLEELVEMGKRHVSLGHQYGEGWLLTAEMVELIEAGVPNIVCVQPFGCLPNHITGKGVIKTLRESYEDANIVALDYDPGASLVNQLNRLRLMLSSAKDKFYEKVKN